MSPQEFLPRALVAARAADHIFPEFAACEAALESGWGCSELAVRANNLFGQKQAHPPRGSSLVLPTREFLNGEWTTVQGQWMQFQNWTESFAERMTLLRSLAAEWPNYREALAATAGPAFIVAVSKSWSTDPARAKKVLEVYRQNLSLLQPMMAHVTT